MPFKRTRLRRLKRSLDANGEQFPSAWDDWHRRRRVAEERFVPWVDAVRPLAGATVLEYGSGSGPVTAAFAPLTQRYIGIDISSDDVATARRLLAEGGIAFTSVVQPPESVIEATRDFRGEVDIFLCYAVLEHLSIAERLKLLEAARDVVREDGIIVVIETPNRLTPWDYHTAQLPFFNHLPESLALRYYGRSKRTQLVAAWREAEALGGGALQDAFVRWGRGMSFHEFELVFDDLPRHVARGGWEPELLVEREIYREELALQRILDTARPDLPPAFSRYWLDIILTPRPAERPPPHVRPWRLETSSSAQAGVAYSDTEVVLLNSNESTLVVALPSPSRRLVITAGGTDRDVALTVHQPAHGISLEGSARGKDRPLDLNFPEPANRYEIRAAEPTTVSFVGYVA